MLMRSWVRFHLHYILKTSFSKQPGILCETYRAKVYYFNICKTKYGIAKKNSYVTRIFHPSARRTTNPFYHVYTKKPFSTEGYIQNTHDSENASAAYA